MDDCEREREQQCKVVAVISKEQLKYERLRRVYSVEYAHPCMATNGTYLTGILIEMNDILPIRDNTKKGYRLAKEGDGIVIDQPRARGTVQDQLTPTVLTQAGGGDWNGSTETHRNRFRDQYEQNCNTKLQHQRTD